jgi:hypothetical protein
LDHSLYIIGMGGVAVYIISSVSMPPPPPLPTKPVNSICTNLSLIHTGVVSVAPLNFEEKKTQKELK